MKNTVKVVYIFCSILFLLYLIIPTQKFPLPPEDALQSNEPADIESSLRKAYFTNSDREEVINNYYSQFASINSYLTFKLIYPPEEAQTVIRDQTRSSYLEEVGHPFRESLFINGFIPKEQKDAIFIQGKNWYQKLTVRFIPSNTIIRVIIGIIVLAFIPLLISEYKVAITDLKDIALNIKKYLK